MPSETLPLIRKYRPKSLDEVIGQDSVVASLRSILKKKAAKTFCLVGPSGTGKTTLARIIATMVGCDPRDILEIDAATNTGIDPMREVTEKVAYSGLWGSGKRVVIVDEAHALSAPAWKSVLKATEEPPEHVYWIFCTTDAAKIPDTVSTRSARYELQPVDSDVLFPFLKKIRKAEGLKTPDKILDLVARKADGSPRRALSILAVVGEETKLSVAAKLLRTVKEGDALAIDLCRLLTRGAPWPEVMAVVKTLGESSSAESVRFVVVDYFTKVAMGAKSAPRAGRAAEILSNFITPYPPTPGMGPLVVSLAMTLLQD